MEGMVARFCWTLTDQYGYHFVRAGLVPVLVGDHKGRPYDTGIILEISKETGLG
jgi:hypothetical protein